MAARPSNPHLALDILRVTAGLVEEVGIDKVTMREVADRIGYSATTIYLYYRNKEELLDQAVTRAFEWLTDHIDAARTSSATPVRIRQGAIAYVDWALRHPNMYRLMFELTRVKPLSQDSHHIRRRAWRSLRALLQQTAEERSLPRVGDLDAAADMVWSSMHGVASLTISGRLDSTRGVQAADSTAAARALALAGAQIDALLAGWAGEHK